MARPPGLPKTGGRKKGKANRKTEIVNNLLVDLAYDPLKEIIALLPQLEASDRVNVALKLLEYCYPKKRPQIEETENHEYIQVIVK